MGNKNARAPRPEKPTRGIRASRSTLRRTEAIDDETHQTPAHEIGGFQAYRSRSTLSMAEAGRTPDTISRRVPISDLNPNMWEIPFTDLDFSEGKVLGRGGFGCVQLASWRGTQVAVKTLFSDCEDSDFFNELNILCRLHHPNIVQLLGYCSSTDHPCLVTEYLQGGSLSDVLTKRKESAEPIELPLFVKIAADICRGMICLHSEKPPIIHRDLKSANILVSSLSLDAAVSVKVADFGISKEHLPSLEHTRYQGTFMYMAPEVFNGKVYTTKVDVFSFALILWEMLTLEKPWSELRHQYQIEEQIVKNNRPLIPKTVSPVVSQLVTDCWESEPNFRPNFDQILKRLQVIGKDTGVGRTNSAPFFPVNQRIVLSESTPTWGSSHSSSRERSGTTYATENSNFSDNITRTNYSDYAEETETLADAEIHQNSILTKFFSTQDSVSWDIFVAECATVFNADICHIEHVKPILTRAGQPVVLKDCFLDLLKWFSPLKREDSIYEQDAKNALGTSFSDIDILFCQPWFHGYIDSNTAAQRLRGRPHGTFLVRFSQTETGNYAASVSDSGKVRHWKILVQNSRHIINNQSFETLTELVRHFKTETLESKNGAVTFLSPCPKK